MCGPALPPSGRARAVPRAPGTGISQRAHSTPIHLIVQNVLSVCRGPDTALTARDPSGTKADVARPLWGLRGQRPMHAIPFCRLPGADRGFFSDSAICREAELFHGPRTDCRHQRRSEHKSQRVGITELPEVVCACEHSPRVSFLPCDP